MRGDDWFFDNLFRLARLRLWAKHFQEQIDYFGAVQTAKGWDFVGEQQFALEVKQILCHVSRSHTTFKDYTHEVLAI